MRIPKQVLVYPVHLSRQGNTVLLLKRTSKLGGFWQGVTGAIEQGESLKDAASRELVEETGFTNQQLKQLDFSYSFPVPNEYAHAYANDVDLIQEFVFMAQVAQQTIPILSREHEDWLWCSFGEALNLLKWPDNKRALKECQAVVGI